MANDSPFFDVENRLNAAKSGAMRIYGVRRCGNHAIINWVIRNSGNAHHVFLNSCTNSRSPVQTCGAAEIDGNLLTNKHRVAKGLETNLARGDHPFLVISYEAGLQRDHYNTGDQTLGFADTDFDKEILITRSFSNWLASFAVLVGRMFPDRPECAVENTAVIINDIAVYKAHILATQSCRDDAAFVHICYDHWYQNPQYRLTMLDQLGLPAVDNGLGAVQRFGGGSSFSKQQNAAQMAISERWRSIKSDQIKQIIRLALQDKELMRLLGFFYPQDPAILTRLASE